MIRLDNVSKQHGKQILFVEASGVVNRGEKVGLVGRSGAGKSTFSNLLEAVVGSENMSVVRGDDMAVRAFVNSCPHRGMQFAAAGSVGRLAGAASGAFKGRASKALSRASGVQ